MPFVYIWCVSSAAKKLGQVLHDFGGGTVFIPHPFRVVESCSLDRHAPFGSAAVVLSFVLRTHLDTVYLSSGRVTNTQSFGGRLWTEHILRKLPFAQVHLVHLSLQTDRLASLRAAPVGRSGAAFGLSNRVGATLSRCSWPSVAPPRSSLCILGCVPSHR